MKLLCQSFVRRTQMLCGILINCPVIRGTPTMADGFDTAIIGDMSNRKTSSRSVLQHLTSHPPMEQETSLFLVVSLLDFLMTYWMLLPRESGPRFGESNAIANWFYAGWG